MSVCPLLESHQARLARHGVVPSSQQMSLLLLIKLAVTEPCWMKMQGCAICQPQAKLPWFYNLTVLTDQTDFLITVIAN